MNDDPLLTWKGRRVRSTGDTPQGAALKVPGAPRPGSLFFVPSPLEGWGLETLLDRMPDPCAVVVFEKDPELTVHCSGAWERHLGARARDPRLFRLESDNEAAVQDLFRRLPVGTLRRCEFLTFNGAWISQGARYREVFSRLENGLTRWWSNRITCMHMGPLWIQNLLTNLSSPSFSLPAWSDWGHDPVLVCGAGVSLESALPWAREHRASLRIVAADTALPVLKSQGLVPDAVVCLEAQHANLRDFAGWVGEAVELYTDLTSFPPGTRVFSQPPRWFITEFTDLSLWSRWPWTPKQIPRLPPLGSVGVAAAWVAWRLSRGPVILAGLDFSYPPGKTHARGAPSLNALAARTTRLEPLEQSGAWLKPGVSTTPQGWLTTPVMGGYAGVLADQARGHGDRTWVWEDRGLKLDLEVWDRTRPLQRTGSGDSGGADETVVDTAGVSAPEWLAGEQELWRTILDDFARINEAPRDPTGWSDLETHLAMADYLTFAFPDPGFRRDSDWLIRAQVQVRWALSRVSRPRRS